MCADLAKFLDLRNDLSAFDRKAIVDQFSAQRPAAAAAGAGLGQDTAAAIRSLLKF